MNEAQKNAIREADNYLKAAGLPTYSDTLTSRKDAQNQLYDARDRFEKEKIQLHTTMFAAAVEIQAHWGAHCAAEGDGPVNLMHRLERGIASRYDYDAETLQRVETERDQLRAEVERYHHLRNGQGWPAVFASHDAPEPIRGDELDTAIDAARTHKETE